MSIENDKNLTNFCHGVFRFLAGRGAAGAICPLTGSCVRAILSVLIQMVQLRREHMATAFLIPAVAAVVVIVLVAAVIASRR